MCIFLLLLLLLVIWYIISAFVPCAVYFMYTCEFYVIRLCSCRWYVRWRKLFSVVYCLWHVSMQSQNSHHNGSSDINRLLIHTNTREYKQMPLYSLNALQIHLIKLANKRKIAAKTLLLIECAHIRENIKPNGRKIREPTNISQWRNIVSIAIMCFVMEKKKKKNLHLPSIARKSQKYRGHHKIIVNIILNASSSSLFLSFFSASLVIVFYCFHLFTYSTHDMHRT